MRNNRQDLIMDMLLKLDDRLDRLEDGGVETGKTLVLINANLAEHMRRTALIEEELKPVKDHVSMVRGVGAFLGILALVATVVAAFKGSL